MVNLLGLRLADIAHVDGLRHDLVDERVAGLDDGLFLLALRLAARLDGLYLVDVLLHLRAHMVLGHDRAREDIEQLLRALAAAADGLNDRHADGLFELLHIDLDAAARRIILHVEVDEQRDALLEELDRQKEVALDVRAVDDVHDEVELVVHEVVDDDLLLRAARVDAVRARQVDD